MFGDRRFGGGGQEPTEIATARTEKRELNETALEGLKKVLTPEQFEIYKTRYFDAPESNGLRMDHVVGSLVTTPYFVTSSAP